MTRATRHNRKNAAWESAALSACEKKLEKHSHGLKIAIAVGLMSSYYLPTDHAALVGAVANQLWLWKA